MRPWNPHAQTFHGEPVVGQTPVRVVVHGPPMTPQQMSYANAAFAAFCSQIRLSTVPNPITQGIFPDGTRYVAGCVEGTSYMTVWPAGAGATGDEGDMVNGIFRKFQAITDVSPPVHRELRKTGGGAYKDTPGFFHKGSDGEYLSPLGFQWFYNETATGMLAVFLQFMRGAAKGYLSYFEREGILPASVNVGNGMTAFGSRVYFYYVSPNGSVQAVAANVVPGREIIKEGIIPREILEMFGGCPIPPTVYDWSQRSEEILSSAAINAVVGFQRYGTYNQFHLSTYGGPEYGTNFTLNDISTSADGKEALYIAHSDSASDPEYRRVWSRAVKITFTENSSGGGAPKLLASASATSYSGVERYDPKGIFGYLPGITSAVVAVMHIDDEPTYFEVERHTYSHSNGGVTPTKMYMNITGGITKRLKIWEVSAAGPMTQSGSFSNSLTYSVIGERTETNPSGSWTKFAVVQGVQSMLASLRQTYTGTERGTITGSGAAILLSEASLGEVTVYDHSVNAIGRTAIGEVMIESGVPGYPTTYFPLDLTSWGGHCTGELVPRGVYAPEYDAYEWSIQASSNDWRTKAPGAATEEDALGQIVGPMIAQGVVLESSSGHASIRLLDPTVAPTKVFAGSAKYSINTVATFESYETENRVTDFRKSGGGLTTDPLYLVRRKVFGDYRDPIAPRVYIAFSRLGKNNVVIRYTAYDWNTEQHRATELNFGPLTTPDMNPVYPYSGITFVGKT